MPIKILGVMHFYSQKNAYETTIEYEDGSEQTFDIPSLRGRGDEVEEGMKPIKNADGLMEYIENGPPPESGLRKRGRPRKKTSGTAQ